MFLPLQTFEALNTQQLKLDQYMFLFYHLTVPLFCSLKRELTLKTLIYMFCTVKLAFLSTLYVLG